MLCPSCGCNQDLLREMLTEPPGTTNHAMASIIVDNCKTCQQAIKEVVENEKETVSSKA